MFRVLARFPLLYRRPVVNLRVRWKMASLRVYLVGVAELGSGVVTLGGVCLTVRSVG